MPLINKIMKKLPRKQVLPGELEAARRFKEPLVVPRQQLSEDGKDESGEYPILEREILPERIICPDCGGITLEGLDFVINVGGSCGEGYAPGILFDSISKSICLQY